MDRTSFEDPSVTMTNRNELSPMCKHINL